MTQALSGVRVLDFTQVLAGPFATQQLALLGADVIKIEQPGHGDQTRGLMNDPDDPAEGMSPSFLNCNMGKRSLTLDLKSRAARDIVHQIVRDSDVVVENFRAGVMERLGFGYEALAAEKPDLVYCSISGYGQSGPKAHVPAYDGAIQADSGMMSITGYPETGPTRTGYMPVDMATALNSAFAITAALYRRLATGQGQHIDVAMMDTALVLQTIQLSNFLATGKPPPLLGNRSPTGQPTANSFATADGYMNVLALRDNQVSGLFRVIGREDALADERFATAPARMAHYDETFNLVQEALRQRNRADWLADLAAAGVPAAAIRGFEEVVNDEQFEHRNVFIEFPKPGAPDRAARFIRAGYQTNADSPSTKRPPPHLGEHTDEILGELGYPQGDIDKLREQGII